MMEAGRPTSSAPSRPLLSQGSKLSLRPCRTAAIGLPLHKATREEKPDHLTNGYSPILIECRRRFARWAADLPELPGVTLPPELFNRTGDNWHGLFSIAEAAGGEWPERAKQAAMEEISEEDSNRTLQLLEAIWQIFAEKKVVRMHTKVLLDALKKIEEAPWEAANDGREIDGYWLREKLKGFLPRPANPKEAAELRRSREWRDGKGPALKGYTEDHLREAWWRYLGRETPTEAAKAPGTTDGPNDPASGNERSRRCRPRTRRRKDSRTATRRPGPARRRTRPNRGEA